MVVTVFDNLFLEMKEGFLTFTVKERHVDSEQTHEAVSTVLRWVVTRPAAYDIF